MSKNSRIIHTPITTIKLRIPAPADGAEFGIPTEWNKCPSCLVEWYEDSPDHCPRCGSQEIANKEVE